LIALSLVALVIGGNVVRLFFPQLLVAGITATLMSLLIPIWSIGGLGVLLSLAGWVIYPRMEMELDLDFSVGVDGRYFSDFTRVIACLATSLISLSMIVMLCMPDTSEPYWKLCAIAYFVFCVWAFTLYLSFVYEPRRHLATTTLLNLLTPLLAYVLFPVVWPMLLFFSLRSSPKAREFERAAGPKWKVW
jgi:hypothetical protein